MLNSDMGSNHHHHRHQLHVLLLLCFFLTSESWGWFSSSKETPSGDTSSGSATFGNSVAEFSIEGFNDRKGMKLVENAKRKMVGSNKCWQNAYGDMFAGCSEILAVEEKRSRLAWHLSDCFQRDSARPPFPQCDSESSMHECLKKLDDFAHKVYLEFYLETNSICYHLQVHAFKHETERLVNELKSSAQYVEDKLESIDEKSESLLQGSNKIHDSLNSIDIRTQHVAETAKNVGDHIDVVLRHSESIYEHTNKIAATQSQLEEAQEDMKRKLKDGIAVLKESNSYLGQEIEKLRSEAIEIEKEVIKVGDTMSLKMQNLQSKAEDIGNLAGISLDKQQELLDGQSTALEGLNSLSEFYSKAQEESRKALQHFAEFGHRQQEELLQKQEQMKGLHDRLMDNSKSILAAQESFESKQASMFAALDKLFALHNAILLESRMMKAFFIYSLSIIVIYMLTSTKQTYNVRPWLYIGLCATLLMEVIILRFTNDNIERQTWLISMVRSLFMLAASVQFLYAIFTYRNYEMLNHQILLSLIDKVNNMQRHKKCSCETDDDDVIWSQWIDADLPDDVNCLDDPDYMLLEEVGENSIPTSATPRKYNLRQRIQYG